MNSRLSFINRFLRLTAGCLLAALLLGCCGCKQALEQNRSVHGVFTPQGDIIYNGQTYLNIFQEKLNSYYYNPQSGLFEYPVVYGGPDTTIYVTQPDVPTLLKKVYGEGFSLSGDGLYLLQHIPAPLLGAPEDRYYCRADIYDACLPPLSQDETGYFYEYQTYNAQRRAMNQEPSRFQLTQEQADAIDHILATVTPVAEEAYVGLDYWYPFHLYHMRDDHLRYRVTVIATASGHSLATTFDGETYVASYSVPEELEPILDTITQTGIKELTTYEDYLNQYFDTVES